MKEIHTAKKCHCGGIIVEEVIRKGNREEVTKKCKKCGHISNTYTLHL